MAFATDGDGRSKVPQIAFEIGESESYNDLKECAKLWLKGMPGLKECILILIHETPWYRAPSIKNIDFPALNQVLKGDFKRESEFGPVTYKDLRWTGKISTAFFETWTRDQARETNGTLQFFFYMSKLLL